jgi:hypothetical protein
LVNGCNAIAYGCRGSLLAYEGHIADISNVLSEKEATFKKYSHIVGMYRIDNAINFK